MVVAMLNAVKEVSVETMNVAASEIHEIKPEVNEGTGVAKCAISCDGTSQRRGFSSLKVTVDLRGVFWGKQYSALCINGKYINLYIIAELM